MAEGNKLMSRLTDLLFPPRCAACRALLSPYEIECGVLCGDCAAQWKLAKEEPCGKCFSVIAECRCQTELLEQASCTAFYKLVYYLHGKGTPVQNKVIYRIKNTRDRRTPRFLARELTPLLLAGIEKGEITLENAVISYIPRRRSAYLENGTDQAKELARALSETLNIPVCKCLLRKRGKEKEQKKLNPTERWRNARASYAVSEKASIKEKTYFL